METARQHLGRTAFRVRDNPYLREQAVAALPPHEEATLRQLLTGEIDVPDWLESVEATDILAQVTVGCLPRDLQLVLRKGAAEVGVESVHAFADVPKFWWLVSFMWCQEVGRKLDPLLGEQVLGYRLNRDYLRRPRASSRIFRNEQNMFRKWKNTPTFTAKSTPDEILAVATVDLKSFFYSVNALPSAIIAKFVNGAIDKRRMSDEGQRLTQLLDALHARYASGMSYLNPRGDSSPGKSPLPIGLPSSQILANLTMGIAVRELKARPAIVEVAVYADDILILTRSLPNLLEDPSDFLVRLGILKQAGQNEGVLSLTRSSGKLAQFVVGLKKTAVSYGRASTPEQGNSDFTFEFSDRLFSSSPDADWGGRLRTVLTSPFKRDRIPKELEREIFALSEEIRVGLEPMDAELSLLLLLDELDRGSFLALRSTWTELIACALHVGSFQILNILSDRLERTIEGLETHPETGIDLTSSVKFGLRAAWAQSLAEALAITDLTRPELFDLIDGPISRAASKSAEIIIERARSIRANCFIIPGLVSTPLSEFSSYTGVLYGTKGSSDFFDWIQDSANQTSATQKSPLNLSKAMRFIHLHEACLAHHLWLGTTTRNWLVETFRIFASQPLINGALIAELRAECKYALGIHKNPNPSPATLTDYVLRIATPSLVVNGKQLEWLTTGDLAALSAEARSARKSVKSIVQQSVDRHANLLVLPEWAVLQGQLSWIFARSARHQMLVVFGEAPTVRDNKYINRLWTGMPISDSAGHHACLVPPPRDKTYLSPAEKSEIDKARVAYSPRNSTVQRYQWHGVSFSSLICYEFADIAVRNSFQRDSDLITVSSWNKDWRYFDSIQTSTTRDNYCITVCVNTGQFPGTQVMRPTSSDRAIASSVHGSGDPTVVTRVIDFLPVVLARSSGRRPTRDNGFNEPVDDLSLHHYKALPPGLT